MERFTTSFAVEYSGAGIGKILDVLPEALKNPHIADLGSGADPR